ncbi:MAG: aspartate aminotransferase family protein [Propionibacteriaceae bacterium]|jgi:4-aminobutyrate aminotransferase-like enzyme|nr:aspartate aminotransferase family protein [Propionibacteriaceae bacterium]
MSRFDYLIPVVPFANQVMVRGEGSHLYDAAGRAYLDLTSGQFCTVLGHSNPEVLKRLEAKTARILHTSTSVVSQEVIDCSEALHRISGEMQAYSIVLSTGAEVVEFCLRYAKAMKRKPGVLCFEKGYHGLTLGAQSVTFAGRYARPLVENIYSVPIPPTRADAAQVETSLSEVEQALATHQDIVAFIVEPIVSVGGMVFPPAQWFRSVRELCDKYGVFLVLDECQTGFGRTGEWFAYQAYGFVPDMVAVAKGIGLGYPVAAALFRDQIMTQVDLPITHYSSHQNDPFGAAVINVGIDIVEANDILARVKRAGAEILRELDLVTQGSEHLTFARGLGMMLGVDLRFDGVTNYRAIYHRLSELMMERGVLLQGTDGGHTLRFLPDYLIEVSDVAWALRTLAETLQSDELATLAAAQVSR